MSSIVYVSDSDDSDSLSETVSPRHGAVVPVSRAPSTISKMRNRQTNATSFNVTRFTAIARRFAEKMEDVNTKFEDPKAKVVYLGASKGDVKGAISIV